MVRRWNPSWSVRSGHCRIMCRGVMAAFGLLSLTVEADRSIYEEGEESKTVFYEYA